MRYIVGILLAVFSLLAHASLVCVNSPPQGGGTPHIKVILSDTKGKKIQVEEFEDATGKMVSLGKQGATLVAKGRYMGILSPEDMKGKISDRTYLLISRSGDSTYAELLLIEADGSTVYMARPMPGGPDYYEVKCK